MIGNRVIKALIPARKGSLRVKNKNLAPFCGSSLLELRVKQLQAIHKLDGIVVSSNDPSALEIAQSLGVETHERDDYFASDTISMNEVYENMASNIQCDDVLYALVTTPLVSTQTFKDAIETYAKLDNNCDSITSVADVKDFLLKDGVPLNYGADKIPRSQDLPDIVKLTFSVSILPRLVMKEKRSCLGRKPYFFKVPQLEAIDIDTPLDFTMAEFLYRHFFIEGH